MDLEGRGRSAHRGPSVYPERRACERVSGWGPEHATPPERAVADRARAPEGGKGGPAIHVLCNSKGDSGLYDYKNNKTTGLHGVSGPRWPWRPAPGSSNGECCEG